MKKTHAILLVDDEVKITQILSAYLRKEGYRTFTAFTGQQALGLISQNEISLVVLDLMLPDISGEEVCQKIRLQSRVPVIMLTAKDDESALVNGIKVGADDYISKPFSPRIVVAKIEAVLRRAQGDELVSVPVVYRNGYLSIDFQTNQVRVQGEEITLTPTEYKLLRTLAKAPGRIFTRDQLISFALGDDYAGYDRGIDTYIKTIRSKIEPDRKHPLFILTVHGIGYKFAVEKDA